jgi:hypothetical protein
VDLIRIRDGDAAAAVLALTVTVVLHFPSVKFCVQHLCSAVAHKVLLATSKQSPGPPASWPSPKMVYSLGFLSVLVKMQTSFRDPGASSHAPGLSVERLVASSFCTKSFTLLLVGVGVGILGSFFLAGDAGLNTVHIARPVPSS